MPYTPTTWQDGITLGNQTHMNNLEGQYSEATKSNNADLLAPYVMSGLAVTRHNSYASNVLGNTPLRYFRLDETSGTNAFDSSGNGQNGTYTGGVTHGVAGLLTGDPDTAATFNGSTGYAATPATGLPSGSGAFTIECWLNASAFVGTYPNLALALGEINTSAGNQAVYIGINSANKLEAGAWGSGPFIATSAAATTGTVYHCVLTFSGGTSGTFSFYVNNSLVGTATGTPNVTLGSQGGLFVGAGPDYGGAGSFTSFTHFFNGRIDEVAIYGSALSAATITAHYNAGSTAVTQVDMTSGTVYPAQTDGTTRQRVINSASFTTVTPSTTYYLYAQPDGTTYWSTANTPAANSLAIAQVTTDGSGNVSLVTDKRTLTTTLLPNSAGLIKTPGLASIGSQASVGSFGVPVIIAQALNVHVTATNTSAQLFTVPANGLYRISAYVMENNGTSGNNLNVQASWYDPNTAGNYTAYFQTPGGSLMNGSNSIANGGFALTPIVIYAGSAGSISFNFTDPTHTPNDWYSVVLERLA